jgi:hypothetical protein
MASFDPHFSHVIGAEIPGRVPSPFIVKASVTFPGFTASVDIPISEADEHRLRTRPREAHTFLDQHIEWALAEAVTKAIEAIEGDD